MKLDVLWTPCELEVVELKGRVAVVIDVVRASTTALAALEAGARRLIPAPSVDEAMRVAGSIGRDDVWLCGERGGTRIEGFDLGNSPREMAAAPVADRTLVCSTTNGTPAMCRAAEAKRLLIGCLRNLSAVAARLSTDALSPIIACAGRGGRVCLADALCAGLLARRLRDMSEYEAGDGALAALALANGVGQPTVGWMAATEAGRALTALGLEEDLDYCAAVDASAAVPVFADGGFRLAAAAGEPAS